NGQVLKTINWTGSLAFREKAIVEAGTLEFALLNSNELIAKVTQVNGTSDDYTANNQLSLSFTAAPVLTQPVSLYLVLNNKPTETSWELRNSNGEVVQSGGPYTTPGSIITEPLNMPQGSCYEFVMKDSGGNGLCCGDGVGFYAILEGNSSTPVYTGQSFGYEDHNEISYGYVGISENISADEFQLMPNPTSNAFSFKLSLQNPAHLSLDIFDLSGRLMMNHQFGLLEAGTHTLTQSVRQFKKGMYMVRIESGNEVKTSRLFVE
ncbi:MAG: T9SS type A sorting domain-containing protein, partial [Bacteroidales bacterium]|nr:T9SS type A sorting domain-containing protein [Bacteroidales bacterium]